MLLLHRSQPLLCSQALSFQKKESSYCLSCPSSLPVIRTWPAAFPPGPGNGCSARGSAAAGGGEHRGRVPLHPGEPTAGLQAGLGAPCRSVSGADASPGQGAEGFVSPPCPHCHSSLAASCWMARVGRVHDGELWA